MELTDEGNAVEDFGVALQNAIYNETGPNAGQTLVNETRKVYPAQPYQQPGHGAIKALELEGMAIILDQSVERYYRENPSERVSIYRGMRRILRTAWQKLKAEPHKEQCALLSRQTLGL